MIQDPNVRKDGNRSINIIDVPAGQDEPNHSKHGTVKVKFVYIEDKENELENQENKPRKYRR